ncbi:MAG TPA: hypothetical protein VJ818_06955 [Actinomycetota bacterium]|nr:hypothetical protein [Actinomycetota bacterium]
MNVVARVLLCIVGVVAVMGTIGSAVRTVILPRAVASRITRRVFRSLRAVFDVWLKSASYERTDRVMALYGPISVLALLLTWMLILFAAFTLILWSAGIRPWRDAFQTSGSSLLTLGFQHPHDIPSLSIVFTEAALGLFILALLITYLPTVYGAFSQREEMVALVAVRAGTPPSAVEMLQRYNLIEFRRGLEEWWPRWEEWFNQIEETHTSLPVIAFFRSPQPQHSWVTAAGTILDCAALVSSTVEGPRQPDAELCIRAGYIALRSIAAFFRIPFNGDPAPDDPISITRHEWEAACRRLEQAGVPLKTDRDQAWKDFAGWRVNYDDVLLGLALLTVAPMAEWTSDRSLAGVRSGLQLTRRRRTR